MNQWLKEQLTAETFFGWFIYLPWGGAMIYYGLYDLPGGYRFAFISAGIYLLVLGIRKGTVNRIKQAVKVERLVKARKAAEQSDGK